MGCKTCGSKVTITPTPSPARHNNVRIKQPVAVTKPSLRTVARSTEIPAAVSRPPEKMACPLCSFALRPVLQNNGEKQTNVLLCSNRTCKYKRKV